MLNLLKRCTIDTKIIHKYKKIIQKTSRLEKISWKVIDVNADFIGHFAEI